MLTATFYWLLNMSITASLAGLVLLLLRSIRPLPRQFIYPLWMVVLLRLWLPFGITSRFSILQLLPHRSVPLHSGSIPMTMTNIVQTADIYTPLTISDPMLKWFFQVVSVIWLVVSIALLTVMIVCYFAAIRESRSATHLRHNIYRSNLVASPVVYGIFRPRILLPVDDKYCQDDLIIIHEQIHVRRLDNLWRLLAISTACVHWFNPLIWLFLHCFLTDMERSCDEAVLRGLPSERRRDYAQTLLNTASKHSALLSPFGSKAVTRIQAVLTYRRLSTVSIVFLVLSAACLSVILLTNTQ